MVSDRLIKETLAAIPVGQVVTQREIAKAIDRDMSVVRRVLKPMLEMGLIERVDLNEVTHGCGKTRVGYMRTVFVRADTVL